VAEVFANQGMSMKRVRPAPMGRAYRVTKRTAHLTVRVVERPLKIAKVGADGAAAEGSATAKTTATRAKTARAKKVAATA
jgi:large subunit ribosomal protein L22